MSENELIGKGIAHITSTAPLSFITLTTGGGAVGLYQFHVKIEQAFLFCEGDVKGELFGKWPISNPFVMSQLPLSGTLGTTTTPPQTNGACYGLFGEGKAQVSGNYKLSHPLTVTQ